ncbi:MAG: transcriptional regulator, partial [Treponema sp.]|nr:transcriptional regulator [Treponema sp.]
MKDIEQQSFEELIQIFTDINDKEFMRAFMGCLFTPAECADFADRWILVKEI